MQAGLNGLLHDTLYSSVLENHNQSFFASLSELPIWIKNSKLLHMKTCSLFFINTNCLSDYLVAGGGGGGAVPPRGEGIPGTIGTGGGGGGTPFEMLAGDSISTSSSLLRSVKSKSQSESGRFIQCTNSSQWSSVSDFFTSTSLGTFSLVGLFKTSCFDFDFASPSFALEISPVMSPILESRSL